MIVQITVQLIYEGEAGERKKDQSGSGPNSQFKNNVFQYITSSSQLVNGTWRQFPNGYQSHFRKEEGGFHEGYKREGAMEASDLPDIWIFHEANSYFPYYEFFQMTQNTSIEFMMC